MLEERAVEEVEVLGDGLAPRRVAHGVGERQHRGQREPRPRVGEEARWPRASNGCLDGGMSCRGLAGPGERTGSASRAARTHQMVTRTSSPRYIVSPGFTPNAA